MKTTFKTVSFKDTKTAFAHYSDRKLKKAYKVYQLLGNNLLVNMGTTLTKIALAVHFPIKPFVKPIIFEQFCGGENLKECMPSINLLEQRNVDVSLNYSVEILDSEKHFEKSFCKNKGAIEFAGRKSNVKVVCVKVTGLGFFDVLEKRQDKKELTKKETKAYNRLKTRMDDLCAVALENDVAIYWDAEESWIQDEIDLLVDEFMEKYNTAKAIIFNTYQLYRKDKLEDLILSIERAREKNYYLGAKLVRGAYIEKENEWAEENNLPTKIHSNKADVDEDFNAGIQICLDNLDIVSCSIATHNELSSILATRLMKEKNILVENSNISFSQLYGMGDFISFNLASEGYNVSKYMPFGPVREVIPYLMRRADENSSVDGQMSRELTMLKKELDRRGL